jgi:hypothetical protein
MVKIAIEILGGKEVEINDQSNPTHGILHG